MAEDDRWSTFSADLSKALIDHSSRSLAAKAHWGKTTVADIKSGRRLPTRSQLSSLLAAARFEDRERDAWLARFDATGQHAPADAQDASRTPSTSPAAAVEDLDEKAGATKRASFPRRSIVFGAGVLVAALVVAAGLLWPHSTEKTVGVPSGEASAPSTSPSPAPSAAPSTVFGTIDTPLDGASVGSEAGVVLKGTVGLLGGETLWLVDRSPDGTYTADTGADLTGPDTWSAEDAPVGDPDDLPHALTILLISADDQCATLLRREVDSDDSSFDALPDGCVVLDRVRVKVDRP